MSVSSFLFYISWLKISWQNDHYRRILCYVRHLILSLTLSMSMAMKVLLALYVDLLMYILNLSIDMATKFEKKFLRTNNRLAGKLLVLIICSTIYSYLLCYHFHSCLYLWFAFSNICCSQDEISAILQM